METDAQLIRRLAEGDLSALAGLYERHWQPVFSVLRHRLGSEADAQDTTSEVFLALPEASRRFREEGSVRGWLVGIALRKASELRRRQRSVGLLARLWGARAPTAVDSASSVEARSEVQGLLAELSEPLRDALELRMLHGLEAADIASALGITEKTVWTRIHRARAELRRLRGLE